MARRLDLTGKLVTGSLGFRTDRIKSPTGKVMGTAVVPCKPAAE